MRKIIIQFLFTLLIACSVGFAYAAQPVFLEACVFNVGQANAVVLKVINTDNESNGLIVDFGIGGIEAGRKNHILTHAVDFLQSCKSISVVITHQHLDHYNHIKDLMQKLNTGVIQQVLIGGKCSDKTPKELSSISNASFGKVRAGSFLSSENLFNKTFGLETVELLLPSTSAGNEDHDQNLIVKVNCLGHSILITGDASKKLIDEISSPQQIPNEKFTFPNFTTGVSTDLIPSMNYPSPLTNVSVIVPSHHFSNANGEFDALWGAMLEYRKAPFLTIISSDPSVKEKIPTSETLKKVCFSKTMLDDCFCAPHTVHASYTVEHPLVIDTHFCDIDRSIYLPVFCTSNTEIGYHVTISKLKNDDTTGTVTMEEIKTQTGMAVEIQKLFLYPGSKKKELSCDCNKLVAGVGKIISSLSLSSSSSSVTLLQYLSPLKIINMQEYEELEKAKKEKLTQIIRPVIYFSKLPNSGVNAKK
jgi:hypothetical protein